MATGILYVMSTVIPGLIKIGKTATNHFDDRMYILERNGYNNVTGLQRRFAIEVEDYDEKERMLDEIFAKARVLGSELFALDIDLAIELLSSFDGRQVFPKTNEESKRQVFDTAAKNRSESADTQYIPNGIYYLERKKPSLHVEMMIEDGTITIPTGQHVSENEGQSITDHVRTLRRENVGQLGIVNKDMRFSSPSQAAEFAIGHSCNGWVQWKTEDGQSINIFRPHPV